MRTILALTAFGALGLFGVSGPAAAQGACRSEAFEDARYTVCTFNPSQVEIRLFWRDAAGEPFRTFSAVANAIATEGGELAFAINGGMFQTDFTPVGLHVEDGRELRPANQTSAPAGVRPVPNFYKKPNGVFYLTENEAGVLATERFIDEQPDAVHATQSGPMLVIDGALHPALIEGSRDRTRRAGVGVSSPTEIHFAISEGQVNFHGFARLFRDRLGVRNALFLDGGRGAGIFAPDLRRNDVSWHGGFGPIIGVVER